MASCKIFMGIAELLSMSFVHSLPQEISRPSFSTAPLQLILVCKQWKAVAEETPELWCQFLLNPKPGEGRPGTETCSNVLNYFLRCSRGHRLDVTLAYPYKYDSKLMMIALRTLYAILRTRGNCFGRQVPPEGLNAGHRL